MLVVVFILLVFKNKWHKSLQICSPSLICGFNNCCSGFIFLGRDGQAGFAFHNLKNGVPDSPVAGTGLLGKYDWFYLAEQPVGSGGSNPPIIYNLVMWYSEEP